MSDTMPANLFTKTGRVNGNAAIGDHVRYFDIANQNTDIEVVTGLPHDEILTTLTQPNGEQTPIWHTIGYQLTNLRTGEVTDNHPLNGHGWTFA